MRVWFFSDLHLEFGDVKAPVAIPDADVCIVAGDVLTKGLLPSLEWLQANLATRIPVVFAAGNHEFYHGFLEDNLVDGNTFDGAGRLHFLENSTVEIGDTVFCGCTLWTDFEILGPDWAEFSMREAMAVHNDYLLIRYSKRPYSKLWPVHTLKKHAQSRAFLEDCRRRYAGRKLVFVTHHAPSIDSVEERFKGDLLTPVYASDLMDLMGEGGPALWVHGHVHHVLDYEVRGTRVVCNPRGYPDEEAHALFDFEKVIEI